MSRATLKAIQAAAGNAGEVVYADDVFSTYVYEGTNSAQTITNGIDLAGEGGLVWTKNRDNFANEIDHQLMDSEQGAFRYVLESNTTSARFDFTASILTPSSTGFQLSSASRVNQNGNPYVSWTFRKQPGFFDVVTYTGNGTAGHTINHSLGSTPGMIIFKRYDSPVNWYVAHRYDLSKYLVLNQPAAASSFAVVTATSNTTFTLPNDGSTNASGGSYVAYLFAHDAQDFGTDSDESIIKCGSYTGNGIDNGPEINLGWEPQFYLFKKASGTGNWFMYDTIRSLNVEGVDELYFNPNLDSAETSSNRIGITSTGIKIHDSNDSWNQNGATYIYVAIRRPHKPASEFAATDLFGMDTWSAASAGTPQFTSGFPVDMAFWRDKTNLSDGYTVDRLRGIQYLQMTSTVSEASSSIYKFDYMNGYGSSPSTLSSIQSWMFRRAPGFFDVMAYTGTGGTGTHNHNLGVVPELMIVKGRSVGSNWYIYASPLGNTQLIELDNNGAARTNSSWGNTTPTDSVATIGGAVNLSGSTYIAYLFATVPEISKVGSYTGTGSDVNVNCGFTSGARFVLVKRADFTGNWYLWDSARGIVAGNDPYLLLNTRSAQVTNTDYIDPLSSGFTITSSAPVELNTSGGNYIFLAIA